jgi:hypothetical protein
MWLVQVELPWACFGFEVTGDGWVIEAAPIADWTVGRRGRQVVASYRAGAAGCAGSRYPPGSVTPTMRSLARSRSYTPPSTSSTPTPCPSPTTARSSPTGAGII